MGAAESIDLRSDREQKLQLKGFLTVSSLSFGSAADYGG